MSNEKALFNRINNAVLDLQGADYQSLPRPYRVLVQTLDSEEFHPFTKELTRQVDLEAFLAQSERSAASIVGSARLAWPDDHRQYLGLCLLLLRKFRDQPDQLIPFAHTYFNGNNLTQSLRKFVSSLVLPFVRDFKEHVEYHLEKSPESDEKFNPSKTSMTSTINIQNFQGILGDISGSTIQQTLNMGLSASDLEGLLTHLRKHNVGEPELTELKLAIEADPKPTSPGAFGERVSLWIGKMLSLSASGAWAVSLGTASNLLSSAIATYYGIAA
ncbi:hypothetical protein [Delftia tsuruhatensis]|uniref:Uncharacterized protein n=1 Tax=Delftia tsuruhatensis TaxID=180282 RepID=A0AAX3STP6_9BURK|nr:hypothetical protein [Delftia tsuruhatensis]WFF83320.1 hypothetical protein PYR84_11685 [Delftia tsuruhatensis]